jgi:hypothetical protein
LQQQTKGKDMQISKLEVKNISHYARGSEETPCYNATVYINGKKAVEVSNDGHGGSDRQHTYPEINISLLDINKWCVEKFGQETWEYNGKTYSTDLDLEHYCHQELYNWLDRKELKKELKGKYICFDEAKKEMFAFGKLKYKTENQDVVMKKMLEDRHPTSKCLNFLDFEEALNVWKEFA